MITDTNTKHGEAEQVGKIGRVGITERTHSLKRRCISKAPRSDAFGPGVGVCMERARFLTQSHKETEGEPEAIRRAKGLAKILDNLAIFIKDGELIVGYTASKPELLCIYPELNSIAMNEILEEPYLNDVGKEELREIASYWKPRTIQARVERMLTEQERIITVTGCAVDSGNYISAHSSPSPGLAFLFKHGYNGIIKIIEEQLAQAEDRIHNGLTHPEIIDYVKKVEQYKAMLIADKAVIRFAKRYSELAAEMAKREGDAKRKAELEEISRICARVPANPPEHFQEALQTIWFVQIVYIMERLSSGCPYRVDQIPWEAFKKDVIEDKTLTRDQAQELFELFRVKHAELGSMRARRARRANQGAGFTMIWTIGGVKSDGTDACNELTEVILDATRSIRTNQPSLAMRYHPRISRRCLLKALECIRAGLSMPSFHNDLHAIPQLVDFGATIEEARDWGMVLCQSPGCQGRKGTRVRNAWSLHPAKSLEMALHDGYDYWFTKRQLTIHTGDAGKFKSYDEVWNAFKGQIHYAAQLGSRVRLLTRYVEAEYFKQPFLSSMWEGCIEKGVDGIAWDEIPNPWFNVIGMIDVADSLCAIKKLVFDDKKYTMAELMKALKANWEGYESMRQEFYNAPKYGNDDDYADSFAVAVLRLAVEEGKQIKNYSGGSPKPLPQAVSQFWGQGEKTGALPSGRRGGEVLADGGCSPYIGCDKKGPTAVVNSAAKLDHGLAKGCLLNQRLSPASIKGEKGADLWLKYVRTVFGMGLNQIQFNVVDSAVLHAAQKEPDKYPDLVVRVAGYSAYFNELNAITQNAIIARTEQVLT